MEPETEPSDRVEAVADASADEEQLVTLAVPPDESLGERIEQVETDHAEVARGDGEPRPLREALDRVRHVLREYEETPDDGLVVYAGQPADASGVVEYVFDDLPTPVGEPVYEWSNEFVTGPLAGSTGGTGRYGLLVVERGGAALGRLEGERVELAETLDSDVRGKTRAGGQSADRFARRREEQKEAFFEDVAAAADRVFDHGALDGLLLGGTEITVEQFREGAYLDHRLRDAVVGEPIGVEYSNEQGLRQLAERAAEREDLANREARAALDRFFDALGDGEVVYGVDGVETALEYEAVETLLLSATLSVERLRRLEEWATEQGGDVVVVSTDLDQGAQFDEAFDGCGAFLRFPIE